MPPWSLISLKYARIPSMNSWYRPPIGFVFAVITATRIVVSFTPRTPGRGTFFARSAALAVVNGVFPTGTVVGSLVCDFELPHAATATLSSTARARMPRARMMFPLTPRPLGRPRTPARRYAAREARGIALLQRLLVGQSR